MFNYLWTQNIMLGVVAVWTLTMGLRGLVRKKPVMFPARRNFWLLVLVLSTQMLPLLPVFFNGRANSYLSDNVFKHFIYLPPLMLGVVLVMMWNLMRGYVVVGATDTSFRGALFHALKQLDLPYEESLSRVRLPTIDADLQVSVQSWMGTAQVKFKQAGHRKTLRRIADEMRAYFDSSTVAVNMTSCGFNVIIGVLMLAMTASLGYLNWSARALVAPEAIHTSQLTGEQASVQSFIESAERGDTAEVVRFLEAGMSPDVMNEKGHTALQDAAGMGHLDTVHALLARGANVEAGKRGYTALMSAAFVGQPETIKALLSAGANINAQDNGGYSALKWAAFGYFDRRISSALQSMFIEIDRDNPRIVQLLLERGANPNTHDKETGGTPLMTAAWIGHAKIAIVLLDGGSEINARNNDGETALICAAEEGRSQTIKVLLERGANINLQDKNGKTALARATEKNHTEAMRLLGQGAI
jgi:ankyrin repeat protein